MSFAVVNGREVGQKIDEILTAVKNAMSSLFTPRAISYRIDKGFDDSELHT